MNREQEIEYLLRSVRKEENGSSRSETLFASEEISETEIETETETEAVPGDEDVTTNFWPYFDGVLNNKDTWEMHIILMPVGGEFADDFTVSAVSFSEDFETAELTSKNHDGTGTPHRKRCHRAESKNL